MTRNSSTPASVLVFVASAAFVLMTSMLLFAPLLASNAQLVIKSDTETLAPETSKNERRGIQWAAAPLCCTDCQYPSVCCCPRRDAIPFTTTHVRLVTKTARTTSTVEKPVYVATKIITKVVQQASKPTANVAAAKRLAQRAQDASAGSVPATQQDQQDTNINTINAPKLLRRHGECPVCPAGAQVWTGLASLNSASSRHDWSQLQGCCPARKTIVKVALQTQTRTAVVQVTKTVKKTKTTTFTTVAGARQTVAGRLYIDVNKNKRFDLNVDKPLQKVKVFMRLRFQITESKNVTEVLAQAETDSNGLFKLDKPTNQAIVTVKADEQGEVTVPSVPAVKPGKLKFIVLNENKDTTSVTGNSATPGCTVNLYANGSTLIGTVVASSDGTFTVPINAAKVEGKKGKLVLTITQVCGEGIESDAVASGDVLIPEPSTTTETHIPITTDPVVTETAAPTTTETSAPQAQTTAAPVTTGLGVLVQSSKTTKTITAAPTSTSNNVPNANSNCTEGTAFGWVSGSPYAPSSATRWALKIGPISPGTYTANLALGASSYKSSGTGSCSSPGTGGGCGTAAGTVSFTLSSSGISATYSIVGGWAIKSHVYYSCSAPVGNEAPGQYNIVSDFTSNPTTGPYTLSSTGSFPSCSGGYYLMLHASIWTGCSSSSNSAQQTTQAAAQTTKKYTTTSTKTVLGGAQKTTTVSSGGGGGSCTEGTGFGWTTGQPYSPSSATRWSLIIGPIASGTYSANLALGASSYKSSSSGTCTTPGTGGGCGTVAASTSYTLSTSAISVQYTPASGHPITKAHVYYSCTKPAGDEAPGSYPIVSDWGASGTTSTFTLSSNGTFPNCGSAYYLMIHASILSGC